MNFKLILRVLGSLAFVEAFFILCCTIMAFCYGEDDTVAFLASFGIAMGTGFLFLLAGKGAEKTMSRKDGYIVVSVSWILFSVIGMFPYLFSHYTSGVTDALFESISGFTSTGTSIMDNIDSCPHALLFWRSLTQWVGGLGIILFTIALIPGIGMGDVSLFAAQSMGPLPGKLQPRITNTAQWIFTVYLALTVGCAVSLYFCGMNMFDAVNHSFTCIGTGGFSTHQNSVQFFNSARIEYVLIAFMFFAGVNYNLLYFFALRGKFKRLFKDTEFKWYTLLFLASTVVCALSLHFDNGLAWEPSLRFSAFQTISLSTSTGFCSHDYMLWAPKLQPLLLLLMVIGGCAGSSAGGFKVVRVAMLWNIAKNESKKMLHPNAVIPLRINGQVVATPAKMVLITFTFLYLLTFFIGWMLLMCFGIEFSEAASCSLSALSNTGPGIGSYGPAYSWSIMSTGAKWVCSALMFIGRLEIMCVFVLFTRSFWKRH